MTWSDSLGMLKAKNGIDVEVRIFFNLIKLKPQYGIDVEGRFFLKLEPTDYFQLLVQASECHNLIALGVK